jgi:HPr kinase/phosphorylase
VANPRTLLMHATCVSLDGYGILLTGPSGSGKSSLALGLMALGMALVSDDMTRLTATPDTITARAPETIRGMIEARGIGLLAAQTLPSTPVRLVIDLSKMEKHRLPSINTYNLLGHSLPLLHKVDTVYFPAAILQYAKGGRIA